MLLAARCINCSVFIYLFILLPCVVVLSCRFFFFSSLFLCVQSLVGCFACVFLCFHTTLIMKKKRFMLLYGNFGVFLEYVFFYLLDVALFLLLLPIWRSGVITIVWKCVFSLLVSISILSVVSAIQLFLLIHSHSIPILFTFFLLAVTLRGICVCMYVSLFFAGSFALLVRLLSLICWFFSVFI